MVARSVVNCRRCTASDVGLRVVHVRDDDDDEAAQVSIQATATDYSEQRIDRTDGRQRHHAAAPPASSSLPLSLQPERKFASSVTSENTGECAYR